MSRTYNKGYLSCGGKIIGSLESRCANGDETKFDGEDEKRYGFDSDAKSR